MTQHSRSALDARRLPRRRDLGVGFAQEPVNDTVVAQIKAEAFQHSAVMDTLSWLSRRPRPAADRIADAARRRASGRAIS